MKKNNRFRQLPPKNKPVFIISGTLLVILTIVIILLFRSEDDRKVLENDFVFLIGLDGADWNILNPLLDQNKLPALRSLIENGCYTDLLAPEQNILSGPSWTSMATGLRVAKHKKTSNFGRVNKPRIWNMLSYFELSNTVVNWICSPDAEKVKGRFITGPYDNPASYPQGLLAEIEAKFGMYYPDVDSREISDRFVRSCFDVSDQRAKIVNYLLEKQMTNFLAVTFTSGDRLQHFYWQYYEPDAFRNPPNEAEINKYRDIIHDYYIRMDEHLLKIMNHADRSRTTFIIVSDHGFEARDQNLLPFRELRLKLLLEKVGLRKIKRDFSLDHTGISFDTETSTDRLTRVLKLENAGHIKKLYSMFKSMKIREDNRPVFRSVSINNSSLTLRLFDRSYPMNRTNVEFEYENERHTYSLEDLINRDRIRTGDHRRAGILILSGNKIRRGGRIGIRNVADIAPTALALFNLPLAKNMDGEPVYEAFTSDFINRFKKRYLKSYNVINKLITRKGAKEKETEERLRSLGYIN